MQPLVDGDIIRYEVGFAAEYAWSQIDDSCLPYFDFVEKILLSRLLEICNAVEATEPPIIYLTGDTNFRFEIATQKEYKGNRKKDSKPWHFNNITSYLRCMYDVRQKEGLEADDLMCIEQMKRLDETIICSRDKDLRQCEGWHYSWELGRQPSFGPIQTDEFGWIKLDEKKKIKGMGSKFFFSQCITGDVVDNIPGLLGRGPAYAFKLLEGCTTTLECLEAVRGAYREIHGDEADTRLLEQGQLLWMVREIVDGEPVMWRIEDEEVQN